MSTSKEPANPTYAVSGKPIQRATYSSFEDIPLSPAEWDDFVASAGGNFFSTFDWCTVWWRHYGKNRKLKIHIYHAGGDIVGIIPLFSERIWLFPTYLDVVKLVGSDHAITHFSLPIREDFIGDVISDLFPELIGEKHDMVWLGPISGLFRHIELIKDNFASPSQGGYATQVRNSGEQTYYHLADTWEEQMLKISKSDAKDLTYSVRRLLKMSKSPTDGIVTEYIDSDSFAGCFQEFVDMHQLNWEKQGMLGHFGDWPGSMDFHKDLAVSQLAKGRLRLLRIRFDGHTLGYSYEYLFDGTSYEVLISRSEEECFSKLSIGKINHSEKMKRDIANKTFQIDSMRGYYDYKIKFGGTAYMTKSIFVESRRFASGIRIWIFRKMSRIIHLGYYRVWFCTLAAHYPFPRSPLSGLWIRTTFLGGLK